MKQFFPILIAIVLFSGGHAFAGEKQECTLPAQECLDRMATEMLSAGIVGVEGDLDESTGGLRITGFIEGTNAEDAGVQMGDILVKVNGIALSDKEAYESGAAARMLGETAAITLLRDGAELTMDLTLVEIPYEMIEEEIGHHMATYHVKTDLDKVKAKRKAVAKQKTTTKRKVKAKETSKVKRKVKD